MPPRDGRVALHSTGLTLFRSTMADLDKSDLYLSAKRKFAEFLEQDVRHAQ